MGRKYDPIELFVSEGDRRSKTIPVDLQDRWVIRIMRFCAEEFEGATALGRGVGAWIGAKGIAWDRITVIEVWAKTSCRSYREGVWRLQGLLMKMGRALRQAAVGAIIGGELTIIPCEVMR